MDIYVIVSAHGHVAYTDVNFMPDWCGVPSKYLITDRAD